jgi:hypothetical protein
MKKRSKIKDQSSREAPNLKLQGGGHEQPGGQVWTLVLGVSLELCALSFELLSSNQDV